MPQISPNPSLFGILSLTDWIIFFFMFFLTIAFVLYGQRKSHTKKEDFDLIDHLIMGRKLTLPFFVATLVATWYGGIFGVTAIAFDQGIYNFVTQGVFWYISYIIFAFFIVDKISRFKALTLPDLISKMFGHNSGKVAAVFNFFNVLPIAYVISLGLFIKSFTNFSLDTSMIIGMFAVLSYTVWGGFRTVVLSDLIQFFTMVLGVLLVIVFSYTLFGGFDFLKANLPESHFSLTGKNTWLETCVWGFIALSTLVDPNFYQRCFAANETKTAKRGILYSTIIWLIFDLCTTFGAMYARAVIPEAESGQAYLIYSIQILPVGLKGFFLAGLLATILSTLDSYLFLAGTTLTYDLSGGEQRENPFYHCMGVLIVGLLSFAMAKFFDGNIKLVWKTLGSYSAGCLLFPVTIGHLSRRKFSDSSFVASCLLSATAITIWRFAPLPEALKVIEPLYIGVLVSCSSLYFINFLHGESKKTV